MAKLEFDQAYDACVNKTDAGTGIRRLFLDSGAFSLFGEHVAKKPPAARYEFYDSKQFRQYVNRYARFVKRHEGLFTHYANVDVIGDPERSYQVQKRLEKKGLKPIPAVHFGSSSKWLRRYIDEGYDYIAFGGLAFRRHNGTTRAAEKWLDRMWSIVCPASNDYRPIVRIHGFGVTSFAFMLRYPWYSVDSTSYNKAAGFGGIYVPYRRRDGTYDYNRPPLHVIVADQVSGAMRDGRNHIATDLILSKKTTGLRARVEQWAEHINIPMGKRAGSDEDEDAPKGRFTPPRKKLGPILEYGITNNKTLRMRACAIYFHHFMKHFVGPETFVPKGTRGLGIFKD
jgi:hypothetical protein